MARTKSMDSYDNEIKKMREQIAALDEKRAKLEAGLQELLDNRKVYQADIIRSEFVQGKRSFEETMEFLKNKAPKEAKENTEKSK